MPGGNRQNSADKSRLELNVYKLNALFDYSSILNVEKSPAHLMARFRQIIEEDLSINRILYFFLGHSGWEVVLNANCSEEMVRGIDVEYLLTEFTDTTVVSSVMLPALREIDVVIPIVRDDKPMAFVLLGDTNEAARGISPVIKHLNFAQTLASISFVALQNFMLFQDAIREERIQQQLRTAANLQRMLIPTPEQLPEVKGVEISTHYQPFYEIGGDYFDIVGLSKTCLAFCIADVSGKGIPAALLMTNFQAHFRAMISAKIPLDTLILRLNDQVNNVTQDDSFITFFVGRYNCKTQTLEYVTAGHNPPFLWRNGAKEIETLSLGCVGLGMVDEILRIKIGRIHIDEPTTLICYTDGIVESRQNGQEVYSTEIMEREMRSGKNPHEFIQAVTAQITQEVNDGTRELFDDISMVAIRFTPHVAKGECC